LLACLPQYFNIPVTPDVSDLSNPVNILKVRNNLRGRASGYPLTYVEFLLKHSSEPWLL
jgi:hypothetical protein